MKIYCSNDHFMYIHVQGDTYVSACMQIADIDVIK